MNPMNIIGGFAGGNPLLSLLNAVRNGGNPMQILQQMSGTDPRIADLMRKGPSELQSMAESLARQRGIPLDTVFQQLGLQNPTRK